MAEVIIPPLSIFVNHDYCSTAARSGTGLPDNGIARTSLQVMCSWRTHYCLRMEALLRSG